MTAAVKEADQKLSRSKQVFTFGSATLIVLAVTSTLAQVMAMEAFGISEYFQADVSTGGLVALIAAGVLGVKCRSWQQWRTWIWVPSAIIIVMSFLVVGQTKQQLEHEGYLPAPVVEEVDEMEPVDMEAEEACQELWEDVVAAQAAELDEIRAGENLPDWASEENGLPPVQWARDEPSAAEEYDRLRAEYDAAC